MKITICLMATVAALVFCGCNFSVGTKKDLLTGLSYSYKGFRVQDVYLTDSGAVVKRSDNKVDMGHRIDIVGVGIQGYELKDGKVYPGMRTSVTDEKGNKIDENKDILTDINGASEQEASLFRWFYIIHPSMAPGSTYHVKLHLWDKVNPKKTLDIDADLVVK